MSILVTGGAGFIGSHFVLDWLAPSDEPVVKLDALTCTGNLANLAALAGDARNAFVLGDIGDRALVDRRPRDHRPRAILHFAAESPLDPSIHGPRAFIKTHAEDRFKLLEAARACWTALEGDAKASFRFRHVSTGEVQAALRPMRQPLPKRAAASPMTRIRPARPPATPSCAPGTAPVVCR